MGLLQAGIAFLIIFIVGGNIFLRLMKIKSFKGAVGEHKTSKALAKLSEYPLIRNPIYKNLKGESCEIDMILLHPTGLYVIENKTFSGWIFGSEDQFQWTQSLSKGNKYHFYNPIKQNQKHIETLKEVLGVYSDIFHNIVIFNDACTLKKINIHSDVIVNNRTQAVSQIKAMMQSKSKFLSKTDLDSFQKKLMEKGHFDRASRKEHIQSIKKPVTRSTRHR